MTVTNAPAVSKLKRTLLIALGSLTLLGATLIWHIQAVTKPRSNGHHANVQLARIDFASALSDQEAATIRSSVDALPGVQHARINDTNNNLVYSYDRAQQDQQNVLDVVKEQTSVPCERLVVSAEEAAMGCPAMVKDGAGRLSTWITALFH